MSERVLGIKITDRHRYVQHTLGTIRFVNSCDARVQREQRAPRKQVGRDHVHSFRITSEQYVVGLASRPTDASGLGLVFFERPPSHSRKIV